MNDNTYNGWTNYATWRVNLEIFDGYDCDAEDRIQTSIDKGCDDPLNDAACDLKEELREIAEEAISCENTLAESYAMTFLDDVNWYEIAKHLLGDVVVYSAGWNMPGYLPECDPALFVNADDALEYLKSECESANEDVDCSSWKADKNGEFGQTFGIYHYYVMKV